MNKATFLPIFFIIIYLLSAINTVYCQDNEQNNEQSNVPNNGQINKQNRKYGFSLGTGFGVAYGQSLEYVYPYRGETKGEFLSKLIWDMKPVCYVGFNADFGLNDLLNKPGFFSSLAVKAGIPGSSGNMEDRDWMSSVNGNLTHFSKHENETNEFLWLDLAVGASFPFKYLYIKPFISGSWTRFSFTGSNGYLQHSKENPTGSGKYDPIETAPIVPIHRKVISYQQEWFLLSAGCSIGTNIYPFSFDLSFKLSPYTYCAATDNHFYSNVINYVVYKDFTGFGLFLEPKGGVSLTVNKFKFLLEASYHYISKTKGESYASYDKNKTFSLVPNKAGAGLSVMDFQFLTKLTF